jgi:hypothetical protein
MYISLQALRAKIRGFAAAGESIHHHIQESKGPKRHRLWNEKRCLGDYNRSHLIAYGLLRGISYERIEHCAPENKPNVQDVFSLIQEHGDLTARKEFTLERVQELLSTSDVETSIAPIVSAESASNAPQESKPTSQLIPTVKRLLEKRA